LLRAWHVVLVSDSITTTFTIHHHRVVCSPSADNHLPPAERVSLTRCLFLPCYPPRQRARPALVSWMASSLGGRGFDAFASKRPCPPVLGLSSIGLEEHLEPPCRLLHHRAHTHPLRPLPSSPPSPSPLVCPGPAFCPIPPPQLTDQPPPPTPPPPYHTTQSGKRRGHHHQTQHPRLRRRASSSSFPPPAVKQAWPLLRHPRVPAPATMTGANAGSS
jgi:hypothetical protein